LKPGRFCLLAALFFLIPYPQNVGARFLIPALPFVALGIALALDFGPALQAALVVAALVLAWPRVIDRYRAPAGGWQIAGMPWQVALHLRDPEAWLMSHSSEYALARTINETVPPNQRVWSTMSVAEAYTKPTVLVYYYSAECETIHHILLTPLRPEFQSLRTLRFTFPRQSFRRLRFVQKTSSQESWSIAEAKFYSGENEVAVSNSDAKPFPWDIGLAFDNNPATRWRSWQPMREGMYVDAVFGKPAEVDRAELRYSGDQGAIKVVLEGVHAKVELLESPVSGDMRRLAAKTVKGRGIDYLLMGGGHPVALDMRKDPEAWGLRLVAERGPDRIYKIQ
jgi:hypothetical protein